MRSIVQLFQRLAAQKHGGQGEPTRCPPKPPPPPAPPKGKGMFNKRTPIPPTTMTDEEKILYLSQVRHGSILPDAFEYDDQYTLIALLARRIVELERRLEAK